MYVKDILQKIRLLYYLNIMNYKKHLHKKYLLLLVIFSISQIVFTEDSPSGGKNIIQIGGFEVRVFKNDQIDFIHAELVVLYQTKDIGSVIPYITARTLFTKNIRSKTQISKSLRALGNDFEIRFMADHLIFKINFLKKKLPEFMKLLAALYKTNKLSVKDLEYEKQSIIENYKKNEQFKIRMGVFSAYKFLFRDQILGNNFFTIDQIIKCKINHIIVHYKGSYNPQNSVLFITGKIIPGIVTGYISNLIRSVPKRYQQIKKKMSSKINRMQRPVILNIKDTLIPTIIYLKVVRNGKNNDLISNLIINDILFKQNLNKAINKNLLTYRSLRNVFVTTSVLNHRDLAVISSSVKVGYKSIGNFLYLLYDQAKQIKMNLIERRSYKRVFNYLYGRLKVNTGNYYNKIDNELKSFLSPNHIVSDVSANRKLLVNVNNIINTERKAIRMTKNNFLENETVVIIGDLDRILRLYPKMNAKIVNIE